jgi:hypothetical protein
MEIRIQPWILDEKPHQNNSIYNNSTLDVRWKNRDTEIGSAVQVVFSRCSLEYRGLAHTKICCFPIDPGVA